MILNIILAVTFLVSISLFWYKISVKIPELVAIPDYVITNRWQEDSSRLRLFLFHIRTYCREGRYKMSFWRFAGKTLYKMHLFILRLDNGMVALLQKIRARGIALNGRDTENSNFWQQLHEHNIQILTPKDTQASARKKV